ncbi:MAG: hypothetical protein KJ814_10095, partial [Proteobacteria bacterium]|nr:hypothetical protein [Pseudomonadota bacterium]
ITSILFIGKYLYSFPLYPSHGFRYGFMAIPYRKISLIIRTDFCGRLTFPPELGTYFWVRSKQPGNEGTSAAQRSGRKYLFTK